MNRADRRKNNAPKEPILVVKEAEIKEKMALVKSETTRTATELTSALFALALHGEWGFGKKRLEKLLERVNTQIECVLSGHLSGGDVVRWCREKELPFFEMEG